MSAVGATRNPPLAAIFAAACASLVGIGLARFAYTPLIPVLIAAGWFAPGQAVYLQAANFGGYVAGALCARWLAARVPARLLLRGMLLLACATFFACAAPSAFVWFFAWRFAAGLAGGVIMVLAAPTVLVIVPQGRRGLASGAIFTGIGLGIAASGTLVAWLTQWGASGVWIGLGLIATGLTALSWFAWPASVPLPRLSPAAPRTGRAIRLVILLYGLNAVGLVPHMVFLVDYVARGLHLGLAAGAACWVAFGAGAMLGPTLTGAAADRVGFARAMQIALAIQAATVAIPLFTNAQPALLISAALTGVFAPGIVPLALGRIHTLAAPGSDAARAAWSRATTAWAVGQFAAAEGFAFLFERSGSALMLFAMGCAALLAALIIDITSHRLVAPRAA